MAHDLSVIPDGETENDLKEIWGSFLVSRNLHCGLSKARAEVYLPNFVVRQFGLIQTAPLPPLSTNLLSSWRADVTQQHGVAGISFQLQQGMTFLTLTRWSRRNAYDENGRVWYEECILTRFIRPVEEAVRGALKNADWDLLIPKDSKVKKVSAGPPCPSTQAVAAPKVTSSPSTGTTAVASTAAPAPRATPVMVGAWKTLAHRTVPSSLPARPIAAAVEEEAAAEAPYVEEAAAAQMVVEEVGAAKTAVEEATTVEEVVEMLDAETAFADVPPIEETAEEAAEEAAKEAANEGVEEAIEEAAADVPVEPLPSAPRCPCGIVFRSETTSSDDLEELYASLHEEGGSSASAPLDEDSKTVVERLQEFLLLGVHKMTAAEALMEFRSYLDTAMALGLLNSAQLDELQARMAEGEEMIGRYAEPVTRMAEGSSLEQDLEVIKEQVRPAMARLKENDLVVQRGNEELAQVEAQIAELQARRDLILQRRDGAVATENELKSSAKQILKAATETKKALVERKLIRARWQAYIDGGDIAWRRITCLIWGMFSEGV
ncbi:uncharacterized protein Pyn_01834 [Prunus yedoensis var. nudiflora]|uniref:Uncharacterized protein n=1 Tax=Prunus yedoensis var. nudiflora TaxID=2094558 RepID=A0A314UY37_PRUYE|nr:uncharacterized protein Pyn_01834 [Prunus yedoensis var. nudiflora]